MGSNDHVSVACANDGRITEEVMLILVAVDFLDIFGDRLSNPTTMKYSYTQEGFEYLVCPLREVVGIMEQCSV